MSIGKQAKVFTPRNLRRLLAAAKDLLRAELKAWDIPGFAARSELRLIHFLWRPFLPDPADDMVLELAVAARATHIVTFNVRHFVDVERVFGIRPVTPGQFLASLPPSP